MRILVVNVGSSTVKLSVTELPADEQVFKAELPIAEKLLTRFSARCPAPGSRKSATEAVGHRVAHGADRFREATRITDSVIAEIVDARYWCVRIDS